MWPLWERERLAGYFIGAQCFCRADRDLLYELFNPIYYSPISCTFLFDFWYFWISRDVRSEPMNLCRNLHNFKPLESGDIHSELLVFRLLWRLVLQSLQVLNAEAVQSELLVFGLLSSTWSEAWSSEAGTVHQNFMSQSLQKLLGKSSELSDARWSSDQSHIFRICFECSFACALQFLI